MSLSQNFCVSRKSSERRRRQKRQIFPEHPATPQRVLAISIGREDNEIFFPTKLSAHVFTLFLIGHRYTLSVHLLLPHFSPTALFIERVLHTRGIKRVKGQYAGSEG